MRRPFALIVAFLLVAPLFVALAAGTASANIIATIPLDKRVEVTPGMYAHLMHVSISDITLGGSYAEDQSKVIYPILVYQYENQGAATQSGHLTVRFVDDQGQSYEGNDAGTMEPIKPGNKSSVRSIEINIPKDRKLTELVVVMGFDEQTFKLSYPGTATPTAAPGTTGTPAASPTGGICPGMVVLPLLIVGAAWIGTRKARK